MNTVKMLLFAVLVSFAFPAFGEPGSEESDNSRPLTEHVEDTIAAQNKLGLGPSVLRAIPPILAASITLHITNGVFGLQMSEAMMAGMSTAIGYPFTIPGMRRTQMRFDQEVQSLMTRLNDLDPSSVSQEVRDRIAVIDSDNCRAWLASLTK